ncbi:MAG: rod shape-determining protein RodA [Candidatus Omnitrophica bacterium]|nr:rod shape-determining protein RodA [Candidatus Omnitrophota bacterium]
MSYKNNYYKILLTVIILLSIGIFSLTGEEGFKKEPPLKDNLVFKQLMWAFIAILIFLFSYFWGYRRFLDISIPLYFVVLGLLLLVLAYGPIRSGAQRWLKLFGLNFQPAEFAKLAMILSVTRYFVSHKDEIKKTMVFIVALTMVILYILLIFLQPDLGSAVILIPIFISIAFICNVNKKNILVLFLLGLLFSPLSWHILKDYQKQRILVFVNPNVDPLGAGYTVIQSKIAIGSGKIFGKIWLKKTTQFSFLPESHTDFIFASIGEKLGFLGTSLIILIYYLLLREILSIGIVTADLEGKAITVGIATMLFLHIFINIGMSLGILPVVGIPLPFISYGGSNLVLNMMALGIVASIEKEH